MSFRPLSLVWEDEHFPFADAYADAMGTSRAHVSRMMMDMHMLNPPTPLELIEASQKRRAATKR